MSALGLWCCAWLFSIVVSRGYSSLWYVGFALQWLLLLQSTRVSCANLSHSVLSYSLQTHGL